MVDIKVYPKKGMAQLYIANVGVHITPFISNRLKANTIKGHLSVHRTMGSRFSHVDFTFLFP